MNKAVLKELHCGYNSHHRCHPNSNHNPSIMPTQTFTIPMRSSRHFIPCKQTTCARRCHVSTELLERSLLLRPWEAQGADLLRSDAGICIEQQKSFGRQIE